MPASTFNPAQPAHRAAYQRGASLVGFVIAALPVIFLGLGSVEVAHWFFTRQAISLALLEAGRAAITSHNNPAVIIDAFENALHPLYGGSSIAKEKLNRSLARRQHILSAAPWQIEVLSPPASAWHDFADRSLHVNGAAGRQAINNNYLAEQDRRYRARGMPGGQGPISGLTIFEANTLVLQLSWPHEPRLPLMIPLLRALGVPGGNYRQRALAAGYLPIVRHMTLTMQSHPVLWSDSPDGKVLFRAEGHAPTHACRGWLCNANQDHSGTVSPDPGGAFLTPPRLPVPSNSSGGRSPEVDDNGTGTALNETTPGSNGDIDTGPGDFPDEPHDPACGVVLCCL